MSRTSMSINIKDGRLVYRTSAVDELKGLYRPVADEVAQAICEGRVERMKVVNAIMKAERFGKDFDWDGFKESERMLNMRQSKVDVKDEPEEKLPDDKPGTVLSLESIVSDETHRKRGRGKSAEQQPEASEQQPEAAE